MRCGAQENSILDASVLAPESYTVLMRSSNSAGGWGREAKAHVRTYDPKSGVNFSVPEGFGACLTLGLPQVKEMAQVLADRILAMDRDPDEYARLQIWRTQFPTREACDADVRCMVSAYAHNYECCAFFEPGCYCRHCIMLHFPLMARGERNSC